MVNNTYMFSYHMVSYGKITKVYQAGDIFNPVSRDLGHFQTFTIFRWDSITYVLENPGCAI